MGPVPERARKVCPRGLGSTSHDSIHRVSSACAGRWGAREHGEWKAGYRCVRRDARGLRVFVGGSRVLARRIGFFELSGFGGCRLVGRANYRRMLAEPLFLLSLRVTLTHVV